MYKIGDKVKTPLGSGKILDFAYFIGMDCKVWKVKLDYKLIDVNTKQTIVLHLTENELTPYRTAHEKLIEMGYEIIKRTDYVFYRHDDLPRITIYSDKTYSCSDTNLALSRILTQYLEELEELEYVNLDVMEGE